MRNIEEKELMDIKERLQAVPKPEDIDNYIRKGIELGCKKKKRQKVKYFSNIAAALFLTVFISLTRSSQVFADYLVKIPGLEYLVNLINYDKGLQEAVENNFIQHVNASVEQEDLVFTIKDIIIDNARGIIFYSIENKGNHRFVNLKEMTVTNKIGEDLKASKSWGMIIDKDMQTNKIIEGKVELNFDMETIIPDTLCIDIKLKEAASQEYEARNDEITLNPTWKFSIPVDKKKFENMQRNYSINETIEIEKQKIIIEDVVINPTRIAVNVEYPSSNTKKILRYDDLQLVNEKGEIWATIINGVSGTRRDDNHETLYFQSNYFTDPKELYIKGSSINALDKDKLVLELDIEENKIIKAPDDRLSLKSVKRTEETTSYEFNINVEGVFDNKYCYHIFGYNLKDSDGNVFHQQNSGFGTDGTNIQRVEYTLASALKLKSPIYINIDDYPQRIIGEFRVKIK